MATETTARRRSAALFLQATVLAMSLIVGFVVGAAYRRPATNSAAPQASSLVEPPQATVIPEDQPRVEALRRDAIRRTSDAIRGECQAAAGGDWEKWQRSTERYRAALKSKVQALATFDPPRSAHPDASHEPLEGLNDFPLFEIAARYSLNYLYEPQTLEQFRKDRLVVAVRRWLDRRGIDLVFVPVAKMTEVYAEHFLDPCPPDGVIAPHVRQTLLEMLAADVEVVDCLALFRPLREPAPDYLYNTCDGHWAPRGMRVMAREVARRIQRYPFAARAAYALPLFSASPGLYEINGHPGGLDSDAGWSALSPGQQARARAVQTTRQAVIRTHDGGRPEDDPASPVMLVGNSFVSEFREQLVRELNLRIRSNWSSGQSTEAFSDFFRDPKLLDGVRVVVWVTTEHHMTNFKPLPPPIRNVLEESP